MSIDNAGFCSGPCCHHGQPAIWRNGGDRRGKRIGLSSRGSGHCHQTMAGRSTAVRRDDVRVAIAIDEPVSCADAAGRHGAAGHRDYRLGRSVLSRAATGNADAPVGAARAKALAGDIAANIDHEALCGRDRFASGVQGRVDDVTLGERVHGEPYALPVNDAGLRIKPHRGVFRCKRQIGKVIRRRDTTDSLTLSPCRLHSPDPCAERTSAFRAPRLTSRDHLEQILGGREWTRGTVQGSQFGIIAPTAEHAVQAINLDSGCSHGMGRYHGVSAHHNHVKGGSKHMVFMETMHLRLGWCDHHRRQSHGAQQR